METDRLLSNTSNSSAKREEDALELGLNSRYGTQNTAIYENGSVVHSRLFLHHGNNNVRKIVELKGAEIGYFCNFDS